MDGGSASAIMEVILGILALAFIAWAGVVWNGVQKVTAVLSELHKLIGELSQRQVNTEKNLDHHEQLPWHGKAGNKISELEARMNSLENHNHGHD